MIKPWITKTAAFMSELAYTATPDIERKDTDTQVIMRIINNYIFVAFRGTSTGKDVRKDLKRIQKDFGHGDVHAGFLECWDSVEPEVYFWLRDQIAVGKRVVFCGHSLGGAVAQLAYISFPGSMCIVFGSPAVGDKDFVQQLEATKGELLLIENGWDIVPRLPVFGYNKPNKLIRQYWTMPKWIGKRPSWHAVAKYRELVKT